MDNRMDKVAAPAASTAKAAKVENAGRASKIIVTDGGGDIQRATLRAAYIAILSWQRREAKEWTQAGYKS